MKLNPKSHKSFISEVHTVVKSKIDDRRYRALVLTNGLKVLLASDAKAEKAAASMSVAVGSMNDPSDIPGLAHLCEHMLFMEARTGSSDSDVYGKGYSKFISEHGGGCNAFTTRDQTNYHFDVAVFAFAETLTRFSTFFTTLPAFPDEAMEQELNLINSEHENKLTNEAWRKMAVEACTAKPGHPFRHFSTGNLETLRNTPKSQGLNVLDCLKGFHAQFYSANIMSLVVLSNEDLDSLEELVVTLFSDVKNLNIVLPIWPENPYGPDECQMQVDIVPLADVRDLYVCFPMPDSRPWFRTFPHGYLSNLLGHKGPGSMFSLLSNKKWVNNTYLNSSVPARGFGYLTIGLQLTVEGLNNVEEIVDIVFNYIAILKKEGPQKYFWEELQRILKIQFNFLDQENAIDFVQRVSNLLHVYPMSDVLSIGYILDNFDETVINNFLHCLNPEFCRIMTVAKSNGKLCDTITEKWYGVKYRERPIDPTLIQKWKDSEISEDMGLPPKNYFIPSMFDLKYVPQPNMQTVPKKICEDQFIKAWFYQDNELSVPKAFIRIELTSFLPMVDPMTFNQNHIMAMMFKESMAEPLYSAILAGLNYTIKGTMYGMEITVDGYDEKIGILADTILQHLMDFDAHCQFFQAKKDSYENGLTNASSQQPYTQVPYHLSLLMREKRFSNEELLSSLTGTELNQSSISEYHKRFMRKLNVECLIYGNLTIYEAATYTRQWSEKFQHFGTSPLCPSQSFRFREVQLPSGSSWVYTQALSNENQSSCCALLFQVGSRTLEDNVLLELFDQVIYEPCFNQLRNREQLGYIVRTSVRKSNGTQGLLIIVQGVSSPQLVHTRIEAFIDTFKEYVRDMPRETFLRHKAAVTLRRNDVPKKLLTRANRLWNNEIYTREYNFSRNKDETMFLQSVDVDHLTTFYNKFFNSTSSDRKCIALYLQSPSTNSGQLNSIQYAYKEVTNITDWKSHMTLSPLFQFKEEV